MNESTITNSFLVLIIRNIIIHQIYGCILTYIKCIYSNSIPVLTLNLMHPGSNLLKIILIRSILASYPVNQTIQVRNIENQYIHEHIQTSKSNEKRGKAIKEEKIITEAIIISNLFIIFRYVNVQSPRRSTKNLLTLIW